MLCFRPLATLVCCLCLAVTAVTAAAAGEALAASKWPTARKQPQQPSQTSGVRIVAFGDSLTSGWGLTPNEAFPAALEAELRQRGMDVTIINAGVAGDTTSDAIARIGQVLEQNPQAVIVEFGANDGLRGISPKRIETNLDAILATFEARGIPVLLAGMRPIMNMNRAYGRDFAQTFDRVAGRKRVAFYPFFLEGVAGVPSLNLPDGLHPNAAGVREIARRIVPFVERLVGPLAPSAR